MAVLDKLTRRNAQFEKFWDDFKAQANPEELQAAIEEQVGICKDLGEKAREAEKAYFADVAMKKSTINDSVAALVAQLSDIQEKIEGLRNPLLEATQNGDSGLLNRVRSELEGFELQRARITSELELLQSADVRGCEKLYNDTIKKNESFEEAQVALSKYACLVVDAEFARLFEKIESRCNNLTVVSLMCTSAGQGVDLDKLDRHHNPEKYAAIEAKELEARRAQAEAWERLKHGPGVISRPASALNPTAPGYDVY